MSLTSYRAAPPRVTVKTLVLETKTPPRVSARRRHFQHHEWVRHAPPAKPGDDLLFHCLSSSTIGAVRFHGRVRDGIGWVTDAMVTKLWDRRFEVLEIVHLGNGIQRHLAEIKPADQQGCR